MTHKIRDIDPNSKKDLSTVTQLHLELLPFGPMAQLGELFLRRFCYTVLLRESLMRAAICEVDGYPVGFIAYTTRSITFHRTAISGHLGHVAFLATLSVIRDPHVALRLPKAVRLMFSRRSEKALAKDPLAEVLAIGVLPEYRKPTFIRRTGLRISRELVAHAGSYFRNTGLKRMRMIIDVDNKPTILFYHGLGGRFEPYEQAGQPSVHVWLDVNRLLHDTETH